MEKTYKIVHSIQPVSLLVLLVTCGGGGWHAVSAEPCLLQVEMQQADRHVM